VRSLKRPPALEHHPHPASQRVELVGIHLVDDLVEDAHAARRGSQRAADQLEERRLPGAARAEDRDDLSAGNVEVEAP
jgi:hypothetical protein